MVLAKMKRESGRIIGLPGNTEDWLQLAAQGAELGLWYWDEVRQKLDWDLKTCEMLGVPPDGKITLQTFIDALHPDDRDRVMRHWRRCVENGVPYSTDMRVVRPDNSVRWIDARGKGYYGKNGEPVCMVGVAFDITDRKRTEQHLARANERLRLSLEAGAVGGWDFDLRTGENAWFGNAHAQLGMSLEETSGSREEFWNHVHEDDREHLRSAMEAAREQHRQFTEEFRVVWRDGTIHRLRSRGRYYYAANGEPERMLGLSGDITERKKAEEALLSSEQRYRLLFERNVAGVGIGSVDGRLLDCNDGWARILGYESRHEVVGRHALEFYFNPADRQPLLDELREKAVFSRELRLKRKDGSPVWVLFNAAAFNSEHNIPIVQCTMIDISESKQAEEALSGMTRKLVEAQEQERARIGRELHDDINQRLAVLSIELELLGDSGSEVQGRVQELKRQLCEISDDVQAISHDLQSSKLEYLGAIAGMKSWCKEVADRCKIEIAFRSNFSGNLPLDLGLPLFRVLQEAVNNAIKHSGEKRIEVQLRKHSGEIHLIISDSGKGFDVETALRGKGLGLTSMRERVRLVNGTITIETRPRGGTNIHVRVLLEGRSNVERSQRSQCAPES